jgi:hypothetical protein
MSRMLAPRALDLYMNKVLRQLCANLEQLGGGEGGGGSARTHCFMSAASDSLVSGDDASSVRCGAPSVKGIQNNSGSADRAEGVYTPNAHLKRRRKRQLGAAQRFSNKLHPGPKSQTTNVNPILKFERVKSS